MRLKLVPNIYKNLNIQSILTIPLFSSGQTIGLLDMSGENIFTGEDLRRVRTISHQLTTVILRKRSEENVKLHLQRISALNEIDRAISSNLDMRISLDVLLGTMLTFL